MAYTTNLCTLGDYDFARQQMVNQATQFADYLDENLLWVKSSDPLNTGYVAGLFHSATWLISPYHWMDLIKDALKLADYSGYRSLGVTGGDGSISIGSASKLYDFDSTLELNLNRAAYKAATLLTRRSMIRTGTMSMGCHLLSRRRPLVAWA